jgi:hypothetical protein
MWSATIRREQDKAQPGSDYAYQRRHAYSQLAKFGHTTLTASASRPSSAVAISRGDAPFAEFGQHGGVVDAQVFADSR